MAPVVLIDIATCENRQLQQYNSDGTVFRGKVNHADIGIFQINEKYHAAEAKKLGYDIYTKSGNIAYALYLYKTQGTHPWDASKACWGS